MGLSGQAVYANSDGTISVDGSLLTIQGQPVHLAGQTSGYRLVLILIFMFDFMRYVSLLMPYEEMRDLVCFNAVITSFLQNVKKEIYIEIQCNNNSG
jgi:hypothetical protein